MEWKKWIKERSWYFWFVVILIIIAIIILITDIGDHKFESLKLLDDDHLEECNEILNEERNEGGVCYVDSNKNKKWKREELCRVILESIYSDKFISIRPDFLKNPTTGRNLELDGYNERLKIAFEHNGKHHYHYPNTFHKTKQEFLNQLSRDRQKKKLCDENGIYLITIPYNIREDELRKYIISKLPRE